MCHLTTVVRVSCVSDIQEEFNTSFSQYINPVHTLSLQT